MGWLEVLLVFDGRFLQEFLGDVLCSFLLAMLTATPQLTPNQKSYQLSKPEIEFHMMEEMYAALCMCTCAEKTTLVE